MSSFDGIFPNAKFSRNSGAFLPDGTALTSNVPRLVGGKFGNGILVEEGVTNLIGSTDRISFKETLDEKTGWRTYQGSTVTVTSNHNDPFGGNKAYRIQSSGGTSLLKYYTGIGAASTSSTPYSFSIWVRVRTGSVVIAANPTNTRQTVLSTSWTLVKIENRIGDGVGWVQLQLCTVNVEDKLDVDVMWPQIEAKAYATTFSSGTRVAETVSIPALSLSHTQGTVEGWVYVNSAVKRGITSVQPTLFVLRNGITTGPWIWVFWASNGLNLQVRKEDFTTSFPNLVIPLADTPDGWHHVAVTYTDNFVRLYLNGIKRLERLNVVMPIGYDRLNVGCRENNNLDCLGSIVDEVRVSTIVRSDAEILASYNATKPHIPDQYTYALLHFDNNLLSHEEVKAVLMPNGNLYIRGTKQVG